MYSVYKNKKIGKFQKSQNKLFMKISKILSKKYPGKFRNPKMDPHPTLPKKLREGVPKCNTFPITKSQKIKYPKMDPKMKRSKENIKINMDSKFQTFQNRSLPLPPQKNNCKNLKNNKIDTPQKQNLIM